MNPIIGLPYIYTYMLGALKVVSLIFSLNLRTNLLFDFFYCFILFFMNTFFLNIIKYSFKSMLKKDTRVKYPRGT
jgi:hypothetical protein